MRSASTPIDGRDLAIGVLCVTACILFVAFLMLTTLSTPAFAGGMNDRSGDYLIVTQQLTRSSEAVVVVDAAAQRMLMYGFDFSRKQLIPLSGFELERLARPGSAQAPGRGIGGGRP